MVKAKLKMKRDILLPDVNEVKDVSTRAFLEKLLKILDEEHTDIYEDMNNVNDKLP